MTVEHPTDERTSTASGSFAARTHKPGSIRLLLDTRVREIRDASAILERKGATEEIPNDAVFAMIGREAPLDFFRRSGIRIAGEIGAAGWAALALFVLFCSWLYNWKSGGSMSALWSAHHWFPFNLPDLLHQAGGAIARDAADPTTLTGMLAISASGPSFWYTIAYSLIVTVFGIRRIRRRRTPYVTVQTCDADGGPGDPALPPARDHPPLDGNHDLFRGAIAPTRSSPW